jgi:hypothetical protein
MAPEKTKGANRIILPPLRPYEMPDTPAVPLPIPPEKDEFAVPGEVPGADELRTLPREVILPPLRPDEVPETDAVVISVVPDRSRDGPEWGTAKRMPEITLGKGKLLRPWDD